MATVFFHRVEAVTKGGPVAPALGNAIAHELGHLLLGRNAHSPTGIMRAYLELRLSEGRQTWALELHDRPDVSAAFRFGSGCFLRCTRCPGGSTDYDLSTPDLQLLLSPISYLA